MPSEYVESTWVWLVVGNSGILLPRFDKPSGVGKKI